MATQVDLHMVESSPFESLLNFRDVARTVNRLQDRVQVLFPSSKTTEPRRKAYNFSSVLHEGRFFRSARPDEAWGLDREVLVKQYHIHNIIDLRSKTEHVQKGKKHGTSTSTPEPVEIKGIDYNYISLNGSAFERALLKRLRYTSLLKLLSLMALGYRVEAISIIGTEVMQPRGLTGLAFDTLATSTAEILSVFHLLAEEKNYPMMIHCTQGKDRTGLIVLLLLLMLRVPVAAIVADYRASERELQPEMEERIGELRKGGLDADFAKCPAGFVEAVVAEIEEKYGGVEKYLSQKVGVDEGMQDRIRNALLVR